MIQADARRGATFFLAAFLLGMSAACSGAANPPANEDMAAPIDQNSAADTVDLRPTGAPAPAPNRSDAYAVSTILGKRDRTLKDGSKACEVDFVYAGREAENLFWEEPCADVTAEMIDRPALEEFGRWERLDAFQRGFVEAMPGGRVLYVEGRFSAAVFPIDETGTSIEVPVAD